MVNCIGGQSWLGNNVCRLTDILDMTLIELNFFGGGGGVGGGVMSTASLNTSNWYIFTGSMNEMMIRAAQMFPKGPQAGMMNRQTMGM